jgi:hypothetical protein
MKNIKMKNLLAENMRRFGTKNLKEQEDSKSRKPDAVLVRLIQFLRKTGATDADLMRGLKIDQEELNRLDNVSVDLKAADQKMEIIMQFPIFTTLLQNADLRKKADIIMSYSSYSGSRFQKLAEEVAITLYFINSEQDAQVVSNYIKNRTKQDLYTWLRSNFSLIEMTTPYVGGVSIIDSLRRLNVPIGTTNLSEQNATEPKRLKLLLMYKDGPQKGTTARQIDVLYGYKNAIKPSSLGAVFNFEIAETSGKRHVGRYVCRSGKIEVLATGPRPVDSTTNRPVDSRSSLPTGIYMISAKAKELMEAITGCSDYVFNDTDVSTTNYV